MQVGASPRQRVAPVDAEEPTDKETHLPGRNVPPARTLLAPARHRPRYVTHLCVLWIFYKYLDIVSDIIINL